MSMLGVRRRWGVRRKTTFAAALLMIVVLLLAGVLLLEVLKRNIVSTAHDQAVSSQQQVLSRLVDGQDTPENRVIYVWSQADPVELLRAVGQPGVLVQLTDQDGSVVAASPSAAEDIDLNSPPLSPGDTFESRTDNEALLRIPSDFVYVSEGIVVNNEPHTLIVAVPVKLQTSSLTVVAVFVLIVGPLLVLLGALTMWWLTGRSLRPVRRITEQVRLIGGSNLDERVDVPPTRDEIAQLASTMNAMLDRLQASDRAQRRFVADASHELRSPLATLSTTLDVARSDPSGETWKELSPVLVSQSQRMGQLVQDLLTLARADDAGLDMRMADTDMDEVVSEEIARIKPALQQELKVYIEPVRLRADASKLQHVVRNLLSNAGRHAESLIEVRLSATDTNAVLTVINDGESIAPEDQDKVFERFVRLDASRARDTGGSGLGLAISREIVLAHGGTIAVDDDPRGRCRFTVTLPLPQDAQ